MVSSEAVDSIFIDRVKNNLHFILSFSPIEKSFRCVKITRLSLNW